MKYVVRFLQQNLSWADKIVVARNMGYSIWNEDTARDIASDIWNDCPCVRKTRHKHKRNAYIWSIVRHIYNL